MDARAALVVLAFLGVGGAAYFALRPRLALASSAAPLDSSAPSDAAPVAAAAHEGGGAGTITPQADLTPEQVQKIGEIQTATQVAKLLSTAPAPNLATKTANQANAMRAMADTMDAGSAARAKVERAASAADAMTKMLSIFGKAQPAEVVFE